MRYLEVVDWDTFQHYKDRAPQWIKLHAEHLDSFEFQCLPDASKAHLVGIWMLASRMKNKIPFEPVWIAQRLSAFEPVNLQLLVDSGFLRIRGNASAVLAERLPDAPRVEEKRVEEKEENLPASRAGKPTWLAPYLDAFQSRVGKPKPGLIATAVEEPHKELGEVAALALWVRWCESDKTQYGAAWFGSNWRKAAKNGSGKIKLTDSNGTLTAEALEALGKMR